MKSVVNAFILLALSLNAFSQNNYCWVHFKDKNSNGYSISNPEEFLSPKAIERRNKQNIAVNATDLPLTPLYLDSVSAFGNIIHRLKWFNLAVINVINPGMIETNITEKKDTVVQPDNVSVTIYDTVIIHHRITASLSGFTYDTVYYYLRDTILDTIPHAGPIVYSDTIYLNDVSFGNKFDSIRQFSFIDSIAEIKSFPSLNYRRQSKFEHVETVNQNIVYPNKYGAAYRQINMLNADLLHQMDYRGAGITIAVMDNGFSNANNIRAYDSIRQRIIATWDFVNHEENVYNDGGHGENVLSCIAANVPNQFLGTAPDASFYLLTTEDDGAEWVMEEYNWAAAAEYADSAGADIFTTSLGYTRFDNGEGDHTYEDLTGNKTIITRAANMAFGKGILVLNSAGNEGASAWRHISAPADGDSVLAIGAVDSAELIANFSGRGPTAAGIIKPDVCSQGIRSAVITLAGDIGYSGGTSFSCPIMAGCAASLWGAFPERSAREIYDAIVISADRFWYPTNDYGYGIPNFYNAYLLLKTNYNGNILRIDGNVSVYPNPFSDELSIALYSDTDKVHRFEIFDLLGRKVYDFELFIRDKTFEVINLEGVKALQAGEYVLRYNSDKNLTHRLVKVK